MSQSTAKRRRRQAANGFKHLPKQRRPKYTRRPIEVMNRRLQQKIEKQKKMAARKRK